MTRKAAMVALALMLSGCMHARFITGQPMGHAHSVDVAYFLYGLIGSPVIETKRFCPNGVAMVDVYRGGLDGFLAFLTIGLYTPKTVTVVCATPAPGAATMPPAAAPGAPPAQAPPAVQPQPQPANPAAQGAPQEVRVLLDEHDRVVAAVAKLRDQRVFIARRGEVREVKP